MYDRSCLKKNGELLMRRWKNVISIFNCLKGIRKVIYMTNAVESLNSAIKKRIKRHRIFSNDESALKAVWLAVIQASKKWTIRKRTKGVFIENGRCESK